MTLMKVSSCGSESRTTLKTRKEVHVLNKSFASGNSDPHSSLKKTTYDLFPQLRSDKLSWCKRNANIRF